MPNCAVEYPLSFRVIASGAFVLGRTELLPGAEVAVSVMLPMPTEWWFRPVSIACRVGAHNAVVWNRLNFNPPAASFSAFGVRQGPPNALDAPNPTSSSRISLQTLIFHQRLMGSPVSSARSEVRKR